MPAMRLFDTPRAASVRIKAFSSSVNGLVRFFISDGEELHLARTVHPLLPQASAIAFNSFRPHRRRYARRWSPRRKRPGSTCRFTGKSGEAISGIKLSNCLDAETKIKKPRSPDLPARASLCYLLSARPSATTPPQSRTVRDLQSAARDRV